jgi:molybdate transport system substrate-binding protein
VTALLTLVTVSPAAAEEGSTITVYAAASLREVIGDVAVEFEKRTGTKVRAEFEASSSLARRIQAGAPVDVFLSADKAWMDAVSPKVQFDWVRNRLVCVTLPDAKTDCAKATTLVLGGEQVPVGKYARAALKKSGALAGKRIIEGSNVRDVLRKVAQGAGEAGVVYQTDAIIEPNVKVASVFPENSHPPIVAPAGLLTDAGRGFYEALHTAWAGELAKKRGFSPSDAQ